MNIMFDVQYLWGSPFFEKVFNLNVGRNIAATLLFICNNPNFGEHLLRPETEQSFKYTVQLKKI